MATKAKNVKLTIGSQDVACQSRISQIIVILSQGAQDAFACCLWYCVVIVLLLSVGKFISSSFLLIFLPGCSKEDAERCHRLPWSAEPKERGNRKCDVGKTMGPLGAILQWFAMCFHISAWFGMIWHAVFWQDCNCKRRGTAFKRRRTRRGTPSARGREGGQPDDGAMCLCWVSLSVQGCTMLQIHSCTYCQMQAKFKDSRNSRRLFLPCNSYEASGDRSSLSCSLLYTPRRAAIAISVFRFHYNQECKSQPR